MQNFALLRAAGAAGLPVLLKRGMSATVEEWLLAAEYLAVSGAAGVVLCERGIRTFENATRNTLDISAVPVAKALSHLPVIVDPSHSGGRRDLVLPLARAAIAAGADGLIVDIHPVPGEALCDGGQALNDDELRDLMEIALVMPAFFGRPCRQVGAGQSLPELHHRLAMVDYHIMAAIGERRHIAQLIGALKHDPGRAVRDPGHEEQVLVEARALAQRFGVPAYTASRVYDCLIADSVQAQGGASEWS
jgi:chorismate mutase